MIDPVSAIPKHQQVVEYIKRLIAREGLQEGDRLPSEKAVAEQFGISLMTVNKALVSLARDGVVTRHRGRGTFVAGHETGRTASAGVWALFLQEPATPELSAELRHSDLSLGVIYRGILSAVQQLGCAIMPVRMHDTDFVAVAARPDVAGLLLVAPEEHRKGDLLNLVRHNMLFVVVSASWPGLGLPCVDGDNVGGARAAVRHLVGLGHRRLAMIISRLDMTNSRDRCLGFQLESCDQGLVPGPIVEISESRPGSWGQIHELLSGADRPSAIFAGGYEHVIRCLQTARDLGLRVPQDLSLVGFDDVPSAARLSPPLTMVRQPWARIARRAVEKLAAMRSQGRPDYSTETLPMDLIVRESCAPPGAPDRAAKEVMA
ncbi:MAG: GntR family transcriptional regulator [Chthonomonadales bacterium]|nr:GntR family transcriptional regulator [Chthonomonadales bacterium]